MKNLVLIGMPGCGKTTFGKLLAEAMQRPFYDADSILAAENGCSIPALYERGEKAFREAETQVVKQLATLEGAVIATSSGVILCEENMELLKEKGIIIFIDRKPEKIITCINDQYRPLLGDDKLKLFEIYKERIELYKHYANVIIGNNGASEVTVAKLLTYGRSC